MPAHTVAQQVQEAIDNLINHGIILPQYMAKLEDRLSILCLDSKVPPAQNGKYSRSEITKHAADFSRISSFFIPQRS
ncbi:hypothetical protein CFRS1_v015707 [Colletotrichum fructicola]|nr:hypothetical protein CFRS1_v015707 [Colletotrichum fructicola]